MKTHDYNKSNKILKKITGIIPGGTTFSKTDLFKSGKTPFACVKAKGCHIWDVDSNKYIDYIMALGPVLLGYQFKPMDMAIKEQLQSGISFSLTHPLELEVAELLIKMIPCAEMVRFGKNGSDSTAAAVRLSRYITKKDHILFCGYHGWHDWYIGQTSKSGGVPESTKKLSHRFNYNDIDSLLKLVKLYKNEIACIFIDPCNRYLPKDNFLQKVRDIAAKNKIILVFDEVITGFRFAKGGAQEYYGVTPDLACFGKALGNGMPISVLVGRRGLMTKFDDLFYTLSCAGETLSLAAAKACLEFYIKNDVSRYIADLGKNLFDGLNKLIADYNLDNILEVQGHYCRPILNVKSIKYDITSKRDDAQTEFIEKLISELCSNGILMNMSHYISYAHKESDIKKTLLAYSNVLKKIKR